jgi:hypothetical protein
MASTVFIIYDNPQSVIIKKSNKIGHSRNTVV